MFASARRYRAADGVGGGEEAEFLSAGGFVVFGLVLADLVFSGLAGAFAGLG